MDQSPPAHVHAPGSPQLSRDRGWCDCGEELRLLDGTWHAVGSPLSAKARQEAARGTVRGMR